MRTFSEMEVGETKPGLPVTSVGSLRRRRKGCGGRNESEDCSASSGVVLVAAG